MLEINRVVKRFLERSALLGVPHVDVLHNSTEELMEAFGKGKEVTLHARNRRARKVGAGKSPNRLEENYLYSTRRFPSLANNTIGSGGLVVNTYPFFTQGMGGDGSALGFPTGFVLTDVETNFEGLGGQVAMGTNFVFNQIGVSFNSDITAADAGILMEAGAIRFSKAGGQFTLNHGPPRLWPGGTGLSGLSATAVGGTPLTINAAHNGSADVRAVRKLTIPRVIREKEQFSYSYVVPRTTAGKDGTTIAMGAFGLMTLWLWGATQIAIPT